MHICKGDLIWPVANQNIEKCQCPVSNQANDQYTTKSTRISGGPLSKYHIVPIIINAVKTVCNVDANSFCDSLLYYNSSKMYSYAHQFSRCWYAVPNSSTQILLFVTFRNFTYYIFFIIWYIFDLHFVRYITNYWLFIQYLNYSSTWRSSILDEWCLAWAAAGIALLHSPKMSERHFSQLARRHTLL